MFTDVSGSCLESIVSFMYSGILRLTLDTVNVMLLVATQLEMSSLIELCQNFILEPRGSDSSAEKETAGCNLDDRANDCSVGDITGMEMPTVKLEEVNGVDDIITRLPSRPSAALTTRTTRSFSRKLQASEACRSSPVMKSSAALDHEQPGRRKHRSSVDTSVQPSVPKKLVSTSCAKEEDPDWKPTVGVCSSPVHRYNTRKQHSHPGVDKPPSSSSNVCVENVLRKHLFSSFRGSLLARNRSDSSTRNKHTAFAAIFRLPSWRRSRSILLAARVFLAKQVTVSDDGLLHCRQCKAEGVSSRSRLNAHVLRRHKHWRSCFTCRQRFASYTALMQHRNSKHRCFTRSPVSSPVKNGPSSESSSSTARSLHNKCGWCGLKFAARSKLVEHREMVHRRRTHSAVTTVCRRVVRDWNCREKDCGMKFKQRDQLRLHMAEYHPAVIFSCPECRFKTQVEHFLRRYCSSLLCIICHNKKEEKVIVIYLL